MINNLGPTLSELHCSLMTEFLRYDWLALTQNADK
jgi:hypothetical protein